MAAAGEFLQAFGIEEMATTWIGWDANSGHLPAIPAAIVVYVSVFVIGHILMNISMLLPQSVRGYTMDFIKTMTLCSYPFGHGILRKDYGEAGYLLGVVPLITITIMTFPTADGNPIGVWLKYFRKALPLRRCIIKSVLQIFAGLAAYHLGMFILSLQLHPVYVERLKEYYNSFCVTDLNVPIYVGFLIEFCGVIYESWFSSLNLINNTTLDNSIKILNGALMVSAGVHLTGMYMHPAMATGHTFGCGDTPRAAHILIYWVGPMIGAWLSVKIQTPFILPKQKKSTAAKTKSKVAPATKVADVNGNMNGVNGTLPKRRRKFFYS